MSGIRLHTVGHTSVNSLRLDQPKGLDVFAQIRSQARGLALFLSALYFLPLLFLCAVIFASAEADLSMAMFTRDPAAIADINPFAGVASNLGVMLWNAAAVICLFSGAITWRRMDERSFSPFMLCSGLLTTILLLDDFFLIHEYVFPKYFGVNEKVVTLGYGILTLGWMMVFRRFILKTEYLILLLALVFFALSIFIDVVQYRIEPVIGDWRILLEDGFKLLGIVAWLGYFLRCCIMTLRKQMGITSVTLAELHSQPRQAPRHSLHRREP